MLSSYNLKNKQTIQISGLILQYCSATTLYRRLRDTSDIRGEILFFKLSKVAFSLLKSLVLQAGICLEILVSPWGLSLSLESWEKSLGI